MGGCVAVVFQMAVVGKSDSWAGGGVAMAYFQSGVHDPAPTNGGAPTKYSRATTYPGGYFDGESARW